MKSLATAVSLVLLAGAFPAASVDCPKGTAVEKLSKNASIEPVAPFDLKSLTKAKATKSAFRTTP